MLRLLILSPLACALGFAPMASAKAGQTDRPVLFIQPTNPGIPQPGNVNVGGAVVGQAGHFTNLQGQAMFAGSLNANLLTGDTVDTLTLFANQVNAGSLLSSSLSMGIGLGSTKLRLWDGGAPDSAIGLGIAPNQFRIFVNMPSDRFTFLGGVAGPELMTLTGTGLLGIGVPSPAAKLQVHHAGAGVGVFAGNLSPFGSAAFQSNLSTPSNHLVFAESGTTVASVAPGGTAFFRERINTEGNISAYRTSIGNIAGSGGGGSSFYNGNGSQYITLSPLAQDLFSGAIAVGDNFSFQRAAMYASLQLGFVQADVKNFVEPNESDPDTDIVYASVEGPEVAAYVRGTAQLVHGRAFVELPEHFRVSCIEEGMTVQLTPRSFHSLGLGLGEVSLRGFEVGELHSGSGSYAFDWEVKAIRKGFKHYEPVRPWDARLPATEHTREELFHRRRIDNERFFRARVERDQGQASF